MTQRMRVRFVSTHEERTLFYEAILPHAESMLTYLNTKPLEALSEADAELMSLMLAFAEVALTVEIQGSDAEAALATNNRRNVIAKSIDAL